MKASTLLALPAFALAYPGLDKETAAADFEKRQLRGLITGLVESVSGYAGAIAAQVDQDNLRPEPGFEFQEPGPDDARGPGPGLNLLANYGYLPRLVQLL